MHHIMHDLGFNINVTDVGFFFLEGTLKVNMRTITSGYIGWEWGMGYYVIKDNTLYVWAGVGDWTKQRNRDVYFAKIIMRGYKYSMDVRRTQRFNIRQNTYTPGYIETVILILFFVLWGCKCNKNIRCKNKFEPSVEK